MATIEEIKAELKIHEDFGLANYVKLSTAKKLLRMVEGLGKSDTPQGDPQIDDSYTGQIATLRARVAELQAQVDRTCEWHDDQDGIWHGTCGIAWAFDAGEMKDNNCNFCPQCGGKIIEAAIKGATIGK